MPPRFAKSRDGLLHQFPEDTTDAEISEFLKAVPATSKTPKTARTWTELTADALPMIGGAAGGILGGIGGMIGGVGVGGPFGAVGGAAVGGAAGEAASQLLRRGAGLPAPDSPMEAATDIGAAGLTQAAAESVGAVAGSALRAGGRGMVKWAVKPTAELLEEYKTTVPELVKTLIDNRVGITGKGLEKLKGLFSASRDDVRQAISAATDTVDKNRVAAQVLPVANRIAKQVNPKADLEAVRIAVDEFMNHPVFQGPTLTLQEAQGLKTGTYSQIRKKYGEMGSASVETQKALAKGLKEELEYAVPGLADKNERNASLMAAIDAVGGRLGQPTNISGHEWLAATHPLTFLATVMSKGVGVKSMLAKGMYKSAGLASGVPPQLIRAAMFSLASSPDDSEGDSR